MKARQLTLPPAKQLVVQATARQYDRVLSVKVRYHTALSPVPSSHKAGSNHLPPSSSQFANGKTKRQGCTTAVRGRICQVSPQLRPLCPSSGPVSGQETRPAIRRAKIKKTRGCHLRTSRAWPLWSAHVRDDSPQCALLPHYQPGEVFKESRQRKHFLVLKLFDSLPSWKYLLGWIIFWLTFLKVVLS